MREKDTPDQREEWRERNQSNGRPPFDISDLDNIPRTTDEDPPYRSWWVVQEPNRRR